MKRGLLLVAVIFISGSLSAQVYTGINIGYGMGATKDVIGLEVDGTTGTNVYGSLGAGINIGARLGYMFNENLGFELGASYLMGSKQTLYSDGTETYEAKSSNLRIAPALVTILDNGLYTRTGLIVPVMGSTIVTATDSSIDSELEMENKGSFSVGFIGALGYSKSLSDNMIFFAELEYIGLRIKQNTSTVTKATVGGQDMLDAIFPTVSDKEIVYVDEIDFASPTPDTEPTQEFAETSPFSSLGLNVGVIIKF
ncbi:MAG: hypothetical protein ABFS32_14850 [Bacteroidota bacterium]